MTKELSNEQVITLALHTIGGVIEPIHTERIAVKAYELAPTKFRWLLDEYKDRVNLAYVYSALSDAKKKNFIDGSLKAGWTITAEGKKFSEQYFKDHKGVEDSSKARDPEEKKLELWKNRQSSRIPSCQAYIKLQNDSANEITKQDIIDFFQVDEYLKPEVRNKKLNRFKIAFEDDPNLSTAVHKLVTIYEEKYAS